MISGRASLGGSGDQKFVQYQGHMQQPRGCVRKNESWRKETASAASPPKSLHPVFAAKQPICIPHFAWYLRQIQVTWHAMRPSFGTNLPQIVKYIWQTAFFKHALGAATVHSHSVSAECLGILTILERTHPAHANSLSWRSHMNKKSKKLHPYRRFQSQRKHFS